LARTTLGDEFNAQRSGGFCRGMNELGGVFLISHTFVSNKPPWIFEGHEYSLPFMIDDWTRT